MKYVNKKRILILSLSGMILTSSVGCANKITETQNYSIEQSEEYEKEVIKKDNNVTSKPEKKSEQKPEKKSDNESTSNNQKEVIEEEIYNTDETNNVTFNTEEDVVKYVDEIEEDVKNSINNPQTKELKTKAIKGFITVVDFVFYDKELGGFKFNDLKDESKQQILDSLYTIDSLIKTKYPDYKEKLKDKYNIASETIKSKYNEVSKIVLEKLKDKIGEEKYENLDKTKEDLKESLDNGKQTISENSVKVKEKVKDWYGNLKQKYN